MSETLGGTRINLKEGERIIWRGRPVQGFLFSRATLLWTALGVVLVLLALALLMQGEAGAAALALPLLAFGLYLIVGHPLLDRKQRAGVEYAITSQRALIAHGAKVKAWPILAQSRITLRKGATDQVGFAVDRQLGVQQGSSLRLVAFRNLADGSEPYALLQDLKARAIALAAQAQ